jgi:hypothetical protein
MKTYLLLLLLSAATVSCKSKKDTASTASLTQPAVTGETVGKVSHQYRSGGCPTVIIVAQEGAEEMVLIPKDKLAKAFDKDGMEIRFNYHTLRMPQPAGCTKGIPAEITDVSAK